MTLDTAVTALHVLSAIFLVGHSFATPHLLSAIRGAPSVAALWPALRFGHDSARASPVAALVLLASGIWLGSGRWDEGWLWLSVVLWVVNTGLAVGVMQRTGERIAALASAAGDGPVPPEIDAVRRSERWTLAAELLVAYDLATLALMYVQPGLVGSLALAAAATIGPFARSALRARSAGGAADVPTAA